MKNFGLADGSATPAFGRVIVVFLLLAALAWGAAWVLRRYGPRWRIAGVSTAGPIQQVARATLPGGIACHVIEVQGSRVLITVTRHGVTSLLLGPAAETKKPELAP